MPPPIVPKHQSFVSVDEPGPLAPSTLQAVRALIFDDLAGELTIARLAEVAKLSPYHFCRAFGRATGLPPHRYIMQARADQAAAAIRTGRRSLSEIAFAHGFADQSHLCRWIRRRYGTTPTGLREGTTIVGLTRGGEIQAARDASQTAPSRETQW